MLGDWNAGEIAGISCRGLTGLRGSRSEAERVGMGMIAKRQLSYMEEQHRTKTRGRPNLGNRSRTVLRVATIPAKQRVELASPLRLNMDDLSFLSQFCYALSTIYLTHPISF